jgi:integrase
VSCIITLTPVLTPDTREGVNMPHPTAPRPSDKPARPYPEFPLFPHATRRWAKKILGKLHYFGPWEDWQGALKKYQEQRDDLHAGRKPRGAGPRGLTVRDLANRFMTAKKTLLESGEMVPRTWQEYYACCERVVGEFGKERLVGDLAADDFEQLRASLAKTRGPVALSNEVQRVRCLFKYAFDAGLIDRPVRFGPLFRRPSRKTLRKSRNARGARMFEAAELRKMIDAADQPLKAMLLLAINCGYGNTDCGTLPLAAVDLDGGWVRYPRPKTGVDRRAPLWVETVAALRAALAKRPEPKDPADAGLVFVTKYGKSWAKQTRDNPVSKETAKLLAALGVKRAGLNFYALRHTFETVAGESCDQVAVDYIMGHAREDMASVYRERISDDRLRAVVEHVRAWLWPPEEKAGKKARGKAVGGNGACTGRGGKEQ